MKRFDVGALVPRNLPTILLALAGVVAGGTMSAETIPLSKIRYTAETKVGAVKLVHVGVGTHRDEWVRVGESFGDGINVEALDQKTGELTVSRGGDRATLFLPGGAVAAQAFDDVLASLPKTDRRYWNFSGPLQDLLAQAAKAAGLELVIRPNTFPEEYGFAGTLDPRQLLTSLLKENGIAAVLEDGKWTLEPLTQIETRTYDLRPDVLEHVKRFAELYPDYWRGISIQPQADGTVKITAQQRQQIQIDMLARSVDLRPGAK